MTSVVAFCAIFTARKRNLGQGNVLHVSFCPRGRVCQQSGVCLPRDGLPPERGGDRADLPPKPEKRTVCILLECFHVVHKMKRKRDGKILCNKNSFQWDAYCPLIDRIPAFTGQGPGGCLHRVCVCGRPIPGTKGRHPLWTDRHLWKHNLRKLCLRAVIKSASRFAFP